MPSNVAEGHTREHARQYLQHVSAAQASLAELQTRLEISTRPGYRDAGQTAELLTEASTLRKQLLALRNSLRKQALVPVAVGVGVIGPRVVLRR